MIAFSCRTSSVICFTLSKSICEYRVLSTTLFILLGMAKEHIVLKSLRIQLECETLDIIQGIHNQIWACGACNSAKGTKGLYEFYKEKYLREKKYYDLIRKGDKRRSYLGLKPLTLPLVYFLQAFSRSTSLIFASVHSHANTSANSSSLFCWLFWASAVASSPTSSMNHMNVAGIPRCWSRFLYFSAISC